MGDSCHTEVIRQPILWGGQGLSSLDAQWRVQRWAVTILTGTAIPGFNRLLVAKAWACAA